MIMFKDFGAPAVETEQTDPVSFMLAGQTFECQHQIPAGLLLDLGGSTSSDSSGGGKAVQAFLNFFRGALKPESFERFEKLIRDPNTIIPMAKLGEISGWLAEVYTDRPTGSNSGASSGNQSSGVGSTEVASPPVVTYARSPEIVPQT